MNPVEIACVAFFDVPCEPHPYKVGLATADALVAITAEFDDLAEAAWLARYVSLETGLPIEMRFTKRVLH